MTKGIGKEVRVSFYLESTAHGLTERSIDEDEGSLPQGRVNRLNAGKIERSAEALLMNEFI